MKSNYPKSLIINPLDFDIFVGMDVDKKSICLTTLDHQGNEKPLKMPYNSSNLIAYLNRHFGDKRIALAYEVGPTGYGLYDDLTALGRRCLVVPPADTPESRSDRVKTNRIDSRKLAHALRGGQLHSVHGPSRLYRDLRHLVALRELFVRQSRADTFRMKRCSCSKASRIRIPLHAATGLDPHASGWSSFPASRSSDSNSIHSWPAFALPTIICSNQTRRSAYLSAPIQNLPTTTACSLLFPALARSSPLTSWHASPIPPFLITQGNWRHFSDWFPPKTPPATGQEVSKRLTHTSAKLTARRSFPAQRPGPRTSDIFALLCPPS